MSTTLSPGEWLVVKKGREQIWQNPRKDNQTVVQPAKISPRNGYENYGYIHLENVQCPTEKGYYHFYQLGDNHPTDFNLIAKHHQWYRLSEWCEVINLVIHIYNKHGKLFPLHDAYMFRTHNDNLVIAILDNRNIANLNDEPVFIHFYRNAFYATPNKDSQDAQIEYMGNTQTYRTPMVELLRHYDEIKNTRHRGSYRLTFNGYLVETIDTNKVETGDVGELHYDMSVRKVVDFPISTLRTFKSELDNINKYLLHPPKDDVKTIDYRDDLEIFVYKRDKKTKTIKGLYYHANMEDSIRMVTHRDWSLPVPYVMHLVEQLDPHPNLDDFFIRVYVRDNGPHVSLVDDVNLIKGLYVLPDDKIVEAMVQVDSVLPEWTASHLEKSAYTALMRSYGEEITPALVLDAMGYSTAVRTLAYPNQRLIKNPNGNYFLLPEGVWETATIYEYDKRGLLLGKYHQKGYKKYYPYNGDCIFIECFAGEGGDELNIHLGREPFTLIPETAYRFYLAKVSLGEPSSEWVDATHDKRIHIDGLTCSFDHDKTNEIGLVWGDDKFLSYDLELDGRDGILDFRLTFGADHLKPLYLPPGKIDLYMNGYALVEDIDYFVNFPDVIIVNKKYQVEKSTQKVHVRCMGFPFTHDGKLKRLKPHEYGFVQHGVISANNNYDIHEDKILRTVVAGGVYDPDVIPFDEKGESKVDRFAKEGSPYSVEHPYISMKGTLGISLYQAQIKDYVLSLKARDYLTYHLPKQERRLPPVIEDKYEVYSPFLSKITADIVRGKLISPLGRISLKTLDKIVEPYKKYLTHDPVFRGYDKHFVNVHAHIDKHYVEISSRDIAFLTRLSKVYLKDEVDVSKYYKVLKGK